MCEKNQFTAAPTRVTLSWGKLLSTQQFIDVVVLVFMRSPAQNIVGKEALRLVLRASHREMREGDTLNLLPLWNIFSEQDDFEFSFVAPAMLRLRMLASDLGFKRVIAPEEITLLNNRDKTEYLHAARVSDGSIKRILNPDQYADALLAAQTNEAPKKRRLRLDIKRRLRRLDYRRIGKTSAITAGFCGLVVAGAIFLIPIDKQPSVSSAGFDSSVTKIYPITKPQLSGRLLRSQVIDVTWFSRPAPERRAAMRSVLLQLGVFTGANRIEFRGEKQTEIAEVSFGDGKNEGTPRFAYQLLDNAGE